jgi:hypothetical protein
MGILLTPLTQHRAFSSINTHAGGRVISLMSGSNAGADGGTNLLAPI